MFFQAAFRQCLPQNFFAVAVIARSIQHIDPAVSGGTQNGFDLIQRGLALGIIDPVIQTELHRTEHQTRKFHKFTFAETVFIWQCSRRQPE